MSDLTEAMALLDRLKLRGWQFARVDWDYQDSPLTGIRRRAGGADVVYLNGVERNCACWRTPDDYVWGSSPPPHATEIHRGDAVSVLTVALSWSDREPSRLIIPGSGWLGDQPSTPGQAATAGTDEAGEHRSARR